MNTLFLTISKGRMSVSSTGPVGDGARDLRSVDLGCLCREELIKEKVNSIYKGCTKAAVHGDQGGWTSPEN